MQYHEREAIIQQGNIIEGYCFLIGGTTYYYTSYYKDVSMGGQTWTALPIERDGLTRGVSLDPCPCTVKIPAASTLAGLLKTNKEMTFLTVGIYRWFAEDTTQYYLLYGGHAQTVDFEDGFCKINCLSRLYKLNRKIPRVCYQHICNNTLYDSVCGLDPALYTAVATVTVSADGKTLTSVAGTLFGSVADGKWVGGKCLDVSSGSYRLITSHSGNNITINYPFTGTITGANNIQVWFGCDKQIATCATRFLASNTAQFVGMPYMPDKDYTQTAIIAEA